MPETVPSLISRSPWNRSDIVWQGAAARPEAVAAAVSAMSQALPGWMHSPHRPDRLRDLGRILAGRRQPIVDLLIREAGKIRIEAEAEADLLVRKIAISLDQGLARTRPLPSDPEAPGGLVLWRPRGVAAILGPFNFPLHLLHGLVVPALAVGCTVVAKPSEHCPALGACYLECLEEAGLSAVCAVVQGGAEVAGQLVDHPAIATVAAVGGRSMGQALAGRLAHRPSVVLALEMGGVNPAIVLDDADREQAVAAVAEGAWKQCGQRCTATRIVHVPRLDLAAWLDALAARRRLWLPGTDPEGPAGRLIDPAAKDRFAAAVAGRAPGIDLVEGDPRSWPDEPCLASPVLGVCVSPMGRSDALYREEHFGPLLIVDPYDDLEECLRRCAANPYRLAASVFTRSAERFRACALVLPYGQVNCNRPTAGARSDLPFGGLGGSGNGRPAAVAAGAIFADETVVWP